MRYKKQLLQIENDRIAALDRVGPLARHLREGGGLQPITCPVRLDQDEVAHFNTSVTLYQHFACDVTYNQSPFVMEPDLVAAAIVRARTARLRAMAAPQWRCAGTTPLILTNQRLLGCSQGIWLSWWYGGIRQLLPYLPGYLVVDLLFDDARPTRLEGLAVPALAVMLTYLLYACDLTTGVLGRGGSARGLWR